MTEDIRTEFEGDSSEEVRADFLEHLGGGGEWFGMLLYDVKERWIQSGIQITDMIIRQGETIRLSITKINIAYVPPKGTTNLQPTEQHIKNVVNKFVAIDPKVGIKRGSIYNFSIAVQFLGNFRVNFSTAQGRMRLTIRLLSYDIPSLEFVNYPDFYRKILESFVSPSTQMAPKPDGTGLMKIETGEVHTGGLVLHVGATGNGKTTAIAAEVGFIANNTTANILTYENPPEYRYYGTSAIVSQFEIGTDIKKTDDYSEFDEIILHLLRNKPDVVLIGEARTHQEMRTVLDIASRGHLVFATIHAANVKEALSTLETAVGNEKHLLTNSLKAVLAHKLIRNEKSEIFGIHEILVVDKIIQNDLGSGNIDGIETKVYKEKMANIQKQTFIEALKVLEKDQKIDMATVNKIILANKDVFLDANQYLN